MITRQTRLSTGKLLASLASAALLAIGVGFAITRNPLRHSPGAPFFISPAALDAGELWAEPDYRHELVIDNRGDDAIEVTTGCHCTNVTPRRFAIPPGGKQTVQVEIDLVEYWSGDAAADSRTRHALNSTIEFKRADGEEHTFAITGEVVLPFTAASVSFDAPCLMGELPPIEYLTVWKDEWIESVDVEISRADGEAIEVPALGSEACVVYQVYPALPRPLGPFRFEAIVRARSHDGREFGPLPVPVTGRVEGDVTWSPAHALLLVSDAQSSPSMDVTLWSRSGQPFRIVEIRHTAGLVDVAVFGDEDDPGRQRLVLKSTYDGDGRASSAVEVDVESGGELVTIPVPVTVQSLHGAVSVNDETTPM